MIKIIKVGYAVNAALKGNLQPRPSLKDLEKICTKFVKLVDEFAHHSPKDKKAEFAQCAYVVRKRVMAAITREKVMSSIEKKQ